MTLIVCISLIFSGWLAWTWWSSLRMQRPSGWRDYLSAAWIATGVLAGVVVAASALFRSVA